MPTFTPEELSALVDLLRRQRTPDLSGAPLSCDHSGGSAIPDRKVTALLPPVDDLTYYAIWVETYLHCGVCGRSTAVDESLGELPTGEGLGFSWVDGRLPTREDVLTACVRDALALRDGSGQGLQSYGYEYVAQRAQTDPELVAGLRSDIERILASYGENSLWT